MIDVKNNRIKTFTALLISYTLLIALLCILSMAGVSGGIAVSAVYASAALFAVYFLKDSCRECIDIDYPEELRGKTSGRCRASDAGDRCKSRILICIKNYVRDNRCRKLFLSVAVLLVLIGVSFLITAVLGASNIPVDELTVNSNISFFVLLNVAVSAFRHVLVPAICEEIYFRRIVFLKLKKDCGISFLLSAILSSLLFMGMHISGVDSMVFAFVSGFILSFLIYFTDSVVYCCAVHFVYNLIAFALIML